MLKKSLQRGVVFNLFVAAENGTGAKTLVSSIYNLKAFPPVKHRLSETLSHHSVDILSESLVLKLNVFVYRGRSSEEISDFIFAKNALYNQNNVGLRRERIEDPRIHASLFLISPLSFRMEDMAMLKTLCELSNTVPVITKRDVFTALELEKYRAALAEQIGLQRLPVFMPEKSPAFPFSTIASSVFITAGDKTVRGREYKWGAISAEDPEISDLPSLVRILVTHHFVDAKRSAARRYNAWKAAHGTTADATILTKSEKELLGELETSIAEKMSARLAFLEEEERALDASIRSLSETAKKC